MITKFKKYNESLRDLMVGPTKEEFWEDLGYDEPFNTVEEYFNYIFGKFIFTEKDLFSKKWKDEYNRVIIIYEQLQKYVDCYLIEYIKIMENGFDLTYDEVIKKITPLLKKELRLDDNIKIHFYKQYSDEFEEEKEY